ncbi:TatD family hydrolase [Prolixibacteraceae bacterium Z1-6]|uniref:TatD family hydrolase n=1 Tax=Draconibacterium aestuarii TaxID=2998507 RepID=A0A9X3F9L3_9BACT|nr:TatD family hydrolase [Prolixibacteraceae bacterium Z1-6]
MNPIPYIDIHTHPFHKETDTIMVQNIYPGEGFAAFSGRNFYSVGLHPWHISTPAENNSSLQMVEEALEFDHVIFVGEAGLDKVCNNDFKEQQRVFEAQAYIAEEYQFPLIIHCVKAFNEVLELYKKMQPAMPWVMHGYNGSLEMTRQLAKNHFLFSFGMNLFKTNSKSVESFRYLPLEKIFFETDEYDGEVDKIYEQGASLKGISIELLKKECWDSFNRIEKSLLSRF